VSDIEEEQQSVWQRLSLKQLRWTVVAVVLATTAAFGGLQTAHHVTSISFGQTYNAGALRVTPHSVSLTDHRVGLPTASPKCRYLVLSVTIQNTANESVPFPLPGIVDGDPRDCVAPKTTNAQAFVITGIAAQFAAIFRSHEAIGVPAVEPGFTNDYSVVWAVSQADLRRHPRISIRFYNMTSFISTFVIAHTWTGDPDHYADLPIPTLELS
jgi:hypothetical protein